MCCVRPNDQHHDFSRDRPQSGTFRSNDDLSLEGCHNGSLFFFQAEDGIRDVAVTGVQTCAPIFFQLGSQAGRWLEKILHPKSRIAKLGVKSGAKVSLMGEFEAEFLREIRALTKSVTKGKSAPGSDQVFFAAESNEDFSALRKITPSLSGAAALWIVYPKGQKHITENDVLFAGRKSGLKDVKVVGFSPTHTALKFVVPLSRR